MLHRLNQVIIQTLETDIPIYANMNVATGKKLGKLLKIISQSVPFKPIGKVDSRSLRSL